MYFKIICFHILFYFKNSFNLRCFQMHLETVEEKLYFWVREILIFFGLPQFSSLCSNSVTVPWVHIKADLGTPTHLTHSSVQSASSNSAFCPFAPSQPFCFEIAACAQVGFWAHWPLLHSGPLLSNAARKRSPVDRGQKYTMGCGLFWAPVLKCTVRFYWSSCIEELLFPCKFWINK